MDKLQEIRQDLIVECRDDWVGFWALIRRLRIAFPSDGDREIRSKTMILAEQLLAVEGMRVGQFEESGFMYWDMTVEEILQKVESEWDKLGREPNLGEILWFAIPPGESSES